MKIRKKVPQYIVNAVVIVLVLIVVSPMVFMFCGSFMGADEIGYYYGALSDTADGEYTKLHFIPQEFTLSQYYDTMFKTPVFWTYFWNSMKLSIPILVGVLLVSTLCGYGLAKYNFAGKRIMLFLYLIVMMLPYQVTLVPNFMILNFFQLIGNRAGVILPNIFTTFGCYLMYQYASKIPSEIIEYARIDGLSEIKIFFHIALPQLKTGIASLTLLNLIDTLGMIEQPLVFLQDVGKQPLSVSLSYINQTNITIAFVSGVIFVIPLILVFLLGKDRLVQGISDSVI